MHPVAIVVCNPTIRYIWLAIIACCMVSCVPKPANATVASTFQYIAGNEHNPAGIGHWRLTITRQGVLSIYAITRSGNVLDETVNLSAKDGSELWILVDRYTPSDGIYDMAKPGEFGDERAEFKWWFVNHTSSVLVWSNDIQSNPRLKVLHEIQSTLARYLRKYTTHEMPCGG